MESTARKHHDHQQLMSKKPTETKKKVPMNIKYISSPVKVQASNASEFWAIVQELTGQNANRHHHHHHEDDQHTTSNINSTLQRVRTNIDDDEHVHQDVDGRFSSFMTFQQGWSWSWWPRPHRITSSTKLLQLSLSISCFCMMSYHVYRVRIKSGP